MHKINGIYFFLHCHLEISSPAYCREISAFLRPKCVAGHMSVLCRKQSKLLYTSTVLQWNISNIEVAKIQKSGYIHNNIFVKLNSWVLKTFLVRFWFRKINCRVNIPAVPLSNRYASLFLHGAWKIPINASKGTLILLLYLKVQLFMLNSWDCLDRDKCLLSRFKHRQVCWLPLMCSTAGTQ